MNGSHTGAPPARVPVAVYLLTATATAKGIADALGMSEAEVLSVLGYHQLRGNVAAKGTIWRLTKEGRDWLRVYNADVQAPTKHGRAARVVLPVKPAKAKPLSAATVRERLTQAGLWPFVEAFAAERGVQAMALAGPERTQYLASVRCALYATLMTYPGRKYSGPDVAWLLGRHDHSTVYRCAAKAMANRPETAA
jgi:hypothetical protein